MSFTFLFANNPIYYDGGIVRLAGFPDVSVNNDIVFQSSTGDSFGDPWTISKTDVTGLVVTDLYTATDPNVFLSCPSWSQDGTKITFSARDETTSPDTFRIWTMNADGSNLTEIWNDQSGVAFGNQQNPRFSPDGDQIIFQTKDPTGTYFILNKMDTTGSSLTTLVDLGGTSASQPDWGVNNQILFIKGFDTLSTCDNDGANITDITLDWGGEAITQVSAPRRGYGDTVFFFMGFSASGNTRLMSAGINGINTTELLLSTDADLPPIPQLGQGLGAFTSHRKFILSVDEVTLGLVDLATLGLTFAEFKNTDFKDWNQEEGDFPNNGVGWDFDSFFISGYKLRGEGIRKFQSNWLKIFFRTATNEFDNFARFNFSGRWDYTISDELGRFTQVQRISQDTPEDISPNVPSVSSSTTRSYVSRRLKVRGRGDVLQIKIQSISGCPFDIIGWTTFDTVNQKP